MWNRDINSFQGRFPRTMRDAFRDADYAYAIEGPRKLSPLERFIVAIIAVVAIALLLVTLGVAYG